MTVRFHRRPRLLAFTALAMQMQLQLTSSGGLGFCTGCGTDYQPRRRPASDRNIYCRGCGDRAAWRDDKRKKRATQRHEE